MSAVSGHVTRVIGVADIRRVQEWIGDANVQTTMHCLHYVPRPQDAARVDQGLRVIAHTAGA